MIVSSACSYSQSGDSTKHKYYGANVYPISLDYTTDSCTFTSSDATNCPLYKIRYTDSTGDTLKTSEKIELLSETYDIPANTYSAGIFHDIIYYKVGLPGNPFTNTALTASSQVCTLKIYFCGLETITAASTGE